MLATALKIPLLRKPLRGLYSPASEFNFSKMVTPLFVKNSAETDKNQTNTPLVPQLEHLGKVKTAIDLDLKNIAYGNVYIKRLQGDIEQTDNSIQTAFATDSLNNSSYKKPVP